MNPMMAKLEDNMKANNDILDEINRYIYVNYDSKQVDIGLINTIQYTIQYNAIYILILIMILKKSTLISSELIRMNVLRCILQLCLNLSIHLYRESLLYSLLLLSYQSTGTWRKIEKTEERSSSANTFLKYYRESKWQRCMKQAKTVNQHWS